MKKVKLHKGRKYSICSCGVSKALPFCDNSHRSFNENNGANYKSIKIVAETTTEVELASANWKVE